MGWFRLASHLHLPVQIVKKTTTSSEFVQWMLYLKKDWNSPSRTDLYLAQIAYQIVRMNVGKKDRTKVKMKDFILKFDTEEKKDTVLSGMERAKRTKSYVSAWLGAASRQLRKGN